MTSTAEIIQLKFKSVRSMSCEECEWDMTHATTNGWDHLRISENGEKVWGGDCVSNDCNRSWCGSLSEYIKTKRVYKGLALCSECFEKK